MNALSARVGTTLLCACPLLVSVIGCHTTESSGWNLSDLGFSARETRRESHALELRSGELLRVDAAYGPIEIVAEDGPPTVEASFSARAKTVEKAREMLARTSLHVSRESDGARIAVQDEPVDQGEGDVHVVIRTEVSLSIRVPAGTRIEVANKSGDMRVRGAAGATELDSSYGAIRVDGVSGDLRARTRSGDVEVARVRGTVIEARSDYGDLRLEDAQADEVEVETSSGDLRIEALSSTKLRAKSSYGDVEIAGGRSEVDASTSSGDVVLEDVHGDVRASSGYGDVRLRRAGGAIDASTSSGDVEVSEGSGSCVARSGYGSIELDGAFTHVDAETSSGSVTVRARPESRIDGAWRLTSSYGDLLLEVAPGIGFEIDARTNYGEVEVGLPLEGQSGASKSALRGRVGRGGSTVRLVTQSGDVDVRALGR